MPNITLEDLTKIAKEIERTPFEDRGDISNAEFAWLYTSRKPLERLKRQTGEIAGLLMMGGDGFVSEDYSGTSAIAHIHNHPSGNMHTSLHDLTVLLGGVVRGENLSFALIASTSSGIVTGFYELEYKGERAKAAALIEGASDIYRARLDKKYDLLDKTKKLRAQMKPGDRILSPQEYHDMVSETMTASSIIGRPRPLNGHRFENFRFVPE